MFQAWPWVVGALAVFWLVGLHNRLMRLRAVVFDTAAVFERSMQALISVSRDAVPAAQAASAMGAALLQSAASLEAGLKNRANPRHARRASQAPLDLGALWAHLQQSWLAYSVAVEGVFEPAALQALWVRWDEADAQGPLARMAANQAIADYHAALDQAPAAWLAGTMGFRKVPPLG
jgi:LemA protein